ncbi:hypothetical protein CU098_010398, partial [Rhizopus stolonifer]
MSAHIIPNSKHKGEKILYQELPPTPSSSALSFMFVPDQKAESKTPSLNHSQYGAMSLASTVNPNDENESLYLLWTHQLLKENTRDNDDDDCSLE